MEGIDASGGELPFTGKSQSLRDKMKRRREAIQNLEASVASNSKPQEEVPRKEVKKLKVEKSDKEPRKERNNKVIIQFLCGLES